MTELTRADGRTPDEMRPLNITENPAPSATGSVTIAYGNTTVICAANIQEGVPGWMKAKGVPGGWLSAEYRMLPYANPQRQARDGSKGQLSGRTQEIQRLIGRSLRAVVDLKKLDGYTIWLDCDVLQADGGTRTASITGAWIALRRAVDKLLAEGKLTEDPITDQIAAVSIGLIDNIGLLDLPYEEDSRADVDMNVVMTGSGELVEIQGCAEGAPFSRADMNHMLDLAEKGLAELFSLQVG